MIREIWKEGWKAAKTMMRRDKKWTLTSSIFAKALI